MQDPRLSAGRCGLRGDRVIDYPAMMQTAEGSNRGPSLVGNLISGALWCSLVGCVSGFLGDEGVAVSVVGGAFTGLLVGVMWYVQARRARRYRASFDPDDRSLRWPEPTAQEKPSFTDSRHRYPVGIRAVAVAGVLMMSAIAVVATFTDASTGVAVGCWVLAIVAGAFAWSVYVTFTEVGVDGVVVRTPGRVRRVGWDEVEEVRWQREASHDVLVFRAVDGREVKAAGVAVAATGHGERRMLRLRDAVQVAWAAGSVKRQRLRLMIRLATAFRSRLVRMEPSRRERSGGLAGPAGELR